MNISVKENIQRMQCGYSKPIPNENETKYCAAKTMIYARQPATAFVFDLGSGITKESVLNVCDTLENIFSLACSIGGPCRIPFVSVMVLTTFHEVLLPMVGVRGNFTRIQNSLKELREMTNNKPDIYSSARAEGVSQTLIEVCMQYQHHWQGSFHSSAPQCLLQVFFITNKKDKNLPEVTKMVEKALETINVDHLKSIKIIGICNFTEIITGVVNDNLSPSSESSENSDVAASMVEVITIESDPLSLQMFFSTLLKDSGSDTEHLHLLFPTSSDELSLIVKCDLVERLINPAQLPFQQQFFLHAECTSSKPLLQPVNKNSGVALPLLKLQIKQTLPSSSLCESLIFGMPYIVEPTSSWKIDWDELERNRKNFQALCHLLSEKKFVLIGSLQSQEIDSSSIISPTRKPGGKYFKGENPKGYFVLLPSPNGTMLIKSLACKELVLNYNQESVAESPSFDNLQVVEASLNKVLQLDTFNPLLEASGLYRSLKKLMTHKIQCGLPKKSTKIPCVESSSSRLKQKPLFISSKDNYRKQPQASNCQNVNTRSYSSAYANDWVDDGDFFTEMN